MNEIDKTGIIGIIGLIFAAVLFLMSKATIITIILFGAICWAIGYLTGSKQMLLVGSGK